MDTFADTVYQNLKPAAIAALQRIFCKFLRLHLLDA